MKVPKYLFLRLCQATAEAASAMAAECAGGLTTGGTVKLEGDAQYTDVPDTERFLARLVVRAMSACKGALRKSGNSLE